MSNIVETLVESDIGPVRLRASDTALVGVMLPRQQAKFPSVPSVPSAPSVPGPHAILDAARSQLLEYFAGRRRSFTIPLAPVGTAFQRAVWATLVEIPFGAHWSYSALAAAVGRPTAVRAVASANARNPLTLFVPCHRVIGSDGALRGYSGGLAAKRWLLEHESAVTAAQRLSVAQRLDAIAGLAPERTAGGEPDHCLPPA